MFGRKLPEAAFHSQISTDTKSVIKFTRILFVIKKLMMNRERKQVRLEAQMEDAPNAFRTDGVHATGYAIDGFPA